jgi:hypothetical protein
MFCGYVVSRFVSRFSRKNMASRREKGIYKFLVKSWPLRKKKSERQCLDLLHSHYHYFVVTRVGEDGCEGFMITHGTTEDFPDNMALKSEHFVEAPGLLPYSDSFFLTVPLIKANELATEEVGLFTDEGLEYLLENAKKIPRLWREYVEDYCRNK